MPERADRSWVAAALLALTVVAGCGGGETKPPEPPQRERAFSAESDAAKRYQRGEFESAARQFAEAERLFTAIDDAVGIARNRRHLARSALHLGRAEEALAHLSGLADRNPDTELLRAQAQLGLGRNAEAAAILQAAAAQCKATCAQEVALQLLLARLALANNAAADAARHARNALARLADQGSNGASGSGDDGREAANGHRLLAEALLAGGERAAAETAAQQALALDRKLALPEKIARDWLLLGHIRQTSDAGQAPQGTSQATPGPDATARQAFQQAREIALAAGLKDILKAADAGLASLAPAASP